MLDQLFYTWGERGLDGLGRFQVVAASRGLRADPVSLATAVQLCQYPTPAGRADRPDSFGWIDDAGLRYAFSRVDAGNDLYGRPNNFAAHVVVGPVEHVPVLDVLGSFGGRQWWRGDLTQVPEDMTLPGLERLAADADTEIASASRQLVCALLARVLEADARVVRLPAAPGELARAAQEIATLLPGVWEGLSFSTFEQGDLSGWFRVHGVAPGTAASPEPGARARRAAEAVLHQRVRSRGLRGALRLATRSGGLDRERLVHVLSELDHDGLPEPGTAVVDGSADALPDLLVLLSDPDTAADAMDSGLVRAAIVQAIGRGDRRVAGSLAALGHALEAEHAADLGAGLGLLVRGDPAAAGRVSSTIQRLPDIATALAASLVEDPRLVDHVGWWPTELVRRVLGHRALAGERLRAVVEAASPAVRELAADPTIPLDRRAAVVVAAMRDPRRDVLDDVVSIPGLLDSVVDSAPESVRAALPATADPTGVLLAVTAPGRGAGEYAAWVRWALTWASVPTRVDLLRHAAGVLPGDEWGWRSQAVNVTLACTRWVCADPGRGDLVNELTAAWAAVDGAGSDPLHLIVRAVGRVGVLGDGDVAALAAVVADLPDAQVVDVARWLFDGVIGRCVGTAAVVDAARDLSALADLADEDLVEAMSVAALRAARPPRHQRAPGRAVLQAVAEMTTTDGRRAGPWRRRSRSFDSPAHERLMAVVRPAPGARRSGS